MKYIKWLLISLSALVAAISLTIVLAPGIHLSSLQMVLNVATGSGANTASDALLARLQAADGYHVSVYARNLPNPRLLKLAENGDLLVSNPRTGEIIALTDSNGDGTADLHRVLLPGLTRPQGLELHDGYLYVGESNQVGRAPYDAATGELTGAYEVVVPNLTDNGNHWSKTLRFDKAGWMYVSMGSTCNVCEEEDPRRATIMRYRADGSEGQVFASGLRNSVGLDFAPWNGTLYATDNGRDLLGDDYPPCELNAISEGAFYGWPYLNGDNELDPDFGAGKEHLQQTAIAPAFPFPPHNAPIGIHFSAEQDRTALVALHGSWNRTTPDGYKIVALHWDSADNISTSDFMWGFELDGDIVGRPVDISGDGHGGYFVSDDYARVIYRVSPQAINSMPVSPEIENAGASPATLTDIETDPQLAQAGELLYRSLPCGECHGGDAATPVPLEKLQQRYDPESLGNYFLAPTPPMPLYDLNQSQRQQLAHYLLSQD